ncbi:DUF6470 family protein [Helicovermis profundi]|uniref:Uncharacterized protein n=1 Tax=Helicovermis profundi TaxID=3065157 RepID=A0AAU9E9P1_9FIRM|nr:hypothetical protein HLPR_25390 [Clostridia bacterium S502]
MKIEINSTNAKIGIKTTNASLSIKQPKADFDLSSTLPKVKIESTLPKVTIDQSAAFSESNLKNPFELTKEFISIAKSAMYKAMAKNVDQGNQLADIHKGGTPIADQAEENAYLQFQRETGMVTMPRSGAKIDVIKGKLDIKVEKGKVNNNIKANKPIIESKMGKVEIYMRQKNSITMKAVKDKFDKKI